MTTTQQDVIKKFMAVLDTTTSQGEAALNEAISAVSSFSSYKDFRAQLLSDCKTVNNADTFLRTYCGIILNNDDTGAITGSDAGGSTTKTAKSVVPEDGELINFTGNEFTVNGLTVKLGKATSSGVIESARTFSDLSEHEQYLWQSVYTWWMNSSLDLIAESYGDNYGFGSDSSAVTHTIWVVFANEGAGSLAVTWGGPGWAQKCTNDLQLHVNLYYYSNATGENGDPQNGQKYLDRVMAHELTHAVMRANIDYFDYLPGFIKEGMAELTHGIDDMRTAPIKTLAGDSSLLEKAIVLNTGTVSLSGVASASYAGGYIFLRYLAHQFADYLITNKTASTSLKTFYGNDTITNSASNVTISAGEGDDSIIGGGTKNFYIYTGGNDIIENFGTTDTLSITGEFYRKKSGDDMTFVTDDGTVTLTGAANLSTLNVTGTEVDDPNPETILTVADSTSSPVTINAVVKVVNASERTNAINITGNALDNTILGGKGNDTLDGGKGDDVLTGGTGDDIFILSTGDDTITDYGTGNDKISIGSAAIKDYGSSGSDFVFDFGNRSLTLTDAADKKISVISGNVTNIFTDSGIFNTLGTAVTLKASTETYTADSNIVTINAGLTSNATITGNTKADKITFGSGENIYVYAGGDDTLENFGSDDTLKISGTVTGASTSGKTSILNVGSNKITVKDSSQVTFTDKGGTKIFDSGILYDEEKTSATLTTSVNTYTASENVTLVTGNANANTLTGSTGNTTLTGGAGNDLFINAGGNDFITDYGNGSDKISLNSSVENFSVTNGNIELELAKGSVTIANGEGKNISLVSGGKTTANIFKGDGIFNTAGTAATLSASTENFTADSKVVTINAGSTSKATITGNSKANRVTLGSEDVFVWTKGGNDTLFNFGEDDTLKISGTVKGASTSGKNSVITVGSNKILVKDYSNKQLTLIDDNGTRIFDSGIFYNENKTSATLTTAVNNYTASETVTSVTGNAKNNTLRGSSDGNTTLTGGKGNDLFINTGGNIFITDYGKGSDKISLGSAIDSFSTSDGNVELGLENGAVTIANASSKKISLVSGGKTTAKIFSGDGMFNSASTAVTLNSSATTYTAGKNVVTINAGSTSNATITGNSKANKVTFGDGENVFIWSKGGNDILTNFGTDDTLSVIGAVSDGTLKSGNSYLKVGSAKITVKNTSEVTISDNNGIKKFSAGIFCDEEETTVTLGSAVSSYSAEGEVTNVTGNAKANKIYANDTDTTLTGGKGNDSLWGGNGSDTFIYKKGDGKDVIYNFDSNDLLEIIGLSGKITGSLNKAGTALTVKVGKTAVAVFKDYATETFNINGDSYYLNGKTLTK